MARPVSIRISEQISLFNEAETLADSDILEHDLEHIQAAYSCRCCEQKNDHVPMKKSVVPPALFPGSGVVSPDLRILRDAAYRRL